MATLRVLLHDLFFYVVLSCFGSGFKDQVIHVGVDWGGGDHQLE